jgi:hypothetical protein
MGTEMEMEMEMEKNNFTAFEITNPAVMAGFFHDQVRIINYQ